MGIESILVQIDAEIARLTQARKLLASSAGTTITVGSVKVKPSAAIKPRKKRVLSAEARKRIADAQKKRWAAQRAKSKKEASKKEA